MPITLTQIIVYIHQHKAIISYKLHNCIKTQSKHHINDLIRLNQYEIFDKKELQFSFWYEL